MIKKKSKVNIHSSVDKKYLKLSKTLKNISIICAAIIVFEILTMTIIKYQHDKKNTYYDVLYQVNIDNNKYIAAGSSQFRYSKFNNWQKGYQKAKMISYNQKGRALWEKTFKSDYNSCFYSAIKIKNGYLAAGNYEVTKGQIESKTRDALIVKYDEKGKVVWYKNYQVLGNTKFTDLLEVEDGYIVIGQSIYEAMEVGNHDMGGGIIVKYDFNGNIIWKNNYGGNKSGIFNGIVEVNDGYIVTGKDAINTGILVKFDKEGNRLWVKNYSYTDKIGFTSIAKTEDEYLLVVGAKEIEKDVYDALVAKYSLDGNIVDEYVLVGDKNERFNSIATTNDGFITAGYTNSSDIGITNFKVDEKDTTAIITKYDKLGNRSWIKSFGGNKEDNLTDITLAIPSQSDIINKTENYIAVGYSKTRFGLFSGMKSNGKDYFSRFIKYNNEGKVTLNK